MGILMKMGKSRAIKKIAKTLPPLLVSGYGHAEFYTPGQVETAMEKANCNADYLDHAYVMFCDEETFSEVGSSDYEATHQEVADLCFDGDSNFSSGDVASFSGDFGGADAGGDGGGGGGD